MATHTGAVFDLDLAVCGISGFIEPLTLMLQTHERTLIVPEAVGAGVMMVTQNKDITAIAKSGLAVRAFIHMMRPPLMQVHWRCAAVSPITYCASTCTHAATVSVAIRGCQRTSATGNCRQCTSHHRTCTICHHHNRLAGHPQAVAGRHSRGSERSPACSV